MDMKAMQRHRIAMTVIGISLVSLVSAARATPVTLPNTFTPGSTIKSSQVNDNFSAVKTAVDDNQAQIDTLKAAVDDNKAQITAVDVAKQNRVTGTCATGSSIAAIKPDGTVTCEVDDHPTYTAALPVAISGSVISLQAGGITNSHISPAAAIAASKIFGDAGMEFGPLVPRVDLPHNSSAPTVLRSIMLSAPTAGTILVIVNGGVHLSDTHMLATLGIGLSPTAYTLAHSQWADGSSTTILPFPAPAAGTYTFYALANETDPGNAGTSWVTDVQLIAVFIPKRY
jgi:hypothetical protein